MAIEAGPVALVGIVRRALEINSVNMSAPTKLFDAFRLGPFALPDRVVMAPLTRNRAQPPGMVRGLLRPSITGNARSTSGTRRRSMAPERRDIPITDFGCVHGEPGTDLVMVRPSVLARP